MISKTTAKFWEKYEKFKKNFQEWYLSFQNMFGQDDIIQTNIEVTNIDYYEDLAIANNVVDAKVENKSSFKNVVEENENGQMAIKKSEYDDVSEDTPEIYYIQVVGDDDDLFDTTYENFDSTLEWFYYVCLNYFRIQDYTALNIVDFYGFFAVVFIFFLLIYDCINNLASFTQFFNQRHAYQMGRNQPRRCHQLLSCFQETTVSSIYFLYVYLTCFM